MQAWQREFPPHPQQKQLKITAEGLYSITRAAEAALFWRTLPRLIPHLGSLTVLDGTANVGSDTIRWAQHTHQVHAIEINPENYAALVHNIAVYKLTNVTTHLGDTRRLYYRWPYDILYLDPPWGGSSYRDHHQLDLFLGTTRLDHFLAQVIRQKHPPRYIVLKLPRNYHFARLTPILPPKAQLRKFWLNKWFLTVIQLPSPLPRHSPRLTPS
jgi:hypothetical protein